MEKELQAVLNDFLETASRHEQTDWMVIFELGALAAAFACLALVPKITDPTEQVMYLFRLLKDDKRHFLIMPVVYLKFCLKENMMPSQKEWTGKILLCVHDNIGLSTVSWLYKYLLGQGLIKSL
ncbi:MAG: hypothetical protein V1867_04220 [Candidatus Falkowbacteria bacterium]